MRFQLAEDRVRASAMVGWLVTGTTREVLCGPWGCDLNDGGDAIWAVRGPNCSPACSTGTWLQKKPPQGTGVLNKQGREGDKEGRKTIRSMDGTP